MRIFVTILILMAGLYYAKVNQESNRTVLGPLASIEDGSRSKYTRNNRESNRYRGNLLRSLRRTAARLQEYDSITPNRKSIMDRQEKSSTRTTKKQDVITIPNSVKSYMLFFTVEGCSSCKTMYPIIKSLQKQRHRIYIVEARENPVLVNQHGIESYPTIIFYGEGKQIKRYKGLVTVDIIAPYLKKILKPNYKLW